MPKPLRNPQGAPTSPMLSNLAAFDLDQKLTAFADLSGFVYTRYADDLTFSACGELPARMSIGDIHRTIVDTIRKCGFRENLKKTRVAGPGSKKVVLGLPNLISESTGTCMLQKNTDW